MKKFLKAEALAAVRGGDFDQGIAKYQEYLALEPNQRDEDAWAALGGAWRRKGNVSSAIESYSRAYQINPGSSYALVNLVSLLAARHHPEDLDRLKREAPKAIELCKKNIENSDATFWTWYDLGTLQLIQGDTSEATKIFHHAIALTPGDAKEYFRSVLSNLRFLHEHNPLIPGLGDLIALVSKHADSSEGQVP
jgi:tetratricopeptide (TPR) repeat protein